jgi:hypothetical protein
MWHNIVAALRIIILTSACPGKIEIQGLSVTCNRGLWFSPGTPVSSTNNTDSHEITVSIEGVQKLLQKLNPQKHVGLTKYQQES